MVTDGTLSGAAPRVGHLLTGDAWAGAEAQAWELVRHLPAHGFAPHVAVLSPGDTLERFTGLNVPVTLLDARGRSRRPLARAVHAWIADSALALVHVHKRKEELLVAFGSTRGGALPLIRTLHGAPELPRGWKRAQGIVARELDFLALRHRTAAVIAVSEALARALRPRVGRTPLRVIHNGVTIPPAVSTNGDHVPRLAYCGRLAPVKAIDRLLRAMPIVRREIPSAELWIAGSGPEELRLRGVATGLGLGDAVTFLGFSVDVQPVFNAVDAVVLCSHHEGLPMIVLEAGAAGKPIVAPRIGGIPEVVQDGETGVLLADATPDAIAAACVPLLRDRAHARALGSAARRRIAAEFSADATAIATAALYTDVLSGKAA